MSTPEDSTPVVTGHVEHDRWDDRSSGDWTVQEAWAHGQRIDAGPPLHNVDEVRLHRGSGTLLLREASCIASVYDLQNLEPRYVTAIAHALEEEIRS